MRLGLEGSGTGLHFAPPVIGLHYFSQIQVTHGERYREAERGLGARRPSRALESDADKQHGKAVTYLAWRHDLTEQGYLDWTHARQLVRVRRVVEDPATGETISIGDRCDVTSLVMDNLSLRHALQLSRAHWRCEVCMHFTCDAGQGEDRRQLLGSRHPHGVPTGADGDRSWWKEDRP